MSSDILILGAGMAGLSAARALRAAGATVQIIDKGRSVGGRLATRRMANGHLDHGAQFFTVRGPEFQAMIDEAIADDVVTEWCRGFDAEPDGFPRYIARHGMNQLAKWMARDLDIVVDTRVEAIRFVDELWRLDVARQAALETDRLIVTAPVPQLLELLTAGFVELPGPLLAELGNVEYFATLGVLAVLDAPPSVPAPGGQQFDSGPFSFVADNQQKGISPVPAITLHANHDYSLSRYDDDEDEVLAELLEMAAPWIGDAGIVEAQLKKWRYAGPEEPVPDRTVLVDLNGSVMALAGDAFGGPKVEGAFNSGLAAAQALLG